MAISKGTKIGRYQITGPIGRGGMAEVYTARDTRLDTDVAIKFIRTDRFPPDIIRGVVKRFQNEAKKMAQLSHPNIVKVTDYGKYEGTPYLVMDYLPGGTFKQYLGKPVPYQQAAGLLLPIANALAYAHARGVIHRDVKPANILISDIDQPMLSDFGVAKMVDSEGAQGLTATGAAIGTPEYMAPEQAVGKEIDHRVDIYSLGVILYELINGRRPYSAETPMQVIIKQSTEALPPASQFVKGLPREVEQVLIKALDKEPKQRFSGMGAFAQELENLSTNAKPSVKTPKVKTKQRIRATPRQKNGRKKLVSLTGQKSTFNIRWVIGAMIFIGAALVVLWVIKLPTGDLLKVEQQTTKKIEDVVEVMPPTSILTSTPEFAQTSIPTIPPTPAGPFEYEVLEGDSCWGIADKFTVDLQSFLAINNFEDGTCHISPGQKIKVPAPGQTPTSALGIGSTIVSKKDGMTLVYIPEGEFEMGSEEGDSDESPVHTVYLDAFLIDQTEVTNTMFAEFLNSEGNQKEGGVTWLDAGDADARILNLDDIWQSDHGYADHPATEVSWYGAKAYCEWAGRRLPTEAEWEKAARGENGRTYPWGENISCSQANYWGCDQFPRTSPVGYYGSAGASPYGAYDMAGNVLEWVMDKYGSRYYEDSWDENPTGPDSGGYRVIRGGSWSYSERKERSANRFNFDPTNSSYSIGFRCALSP